MLQTGQSNGVRPSVPKVTYGHSHFLATGAGLGAAPGLGVVQATHSFLSGALLTSQTKQIQVPAFGLNKSMRDGAAGSLLFSSAFGFSVGLAAPNPKLGGFGDPLTFASKEGRLGHGPERERFRRHGIRQAEK